MARKKVLSSLSRRERQIMEVLYREGRATASEVLERLPDPPGYSAVRALLRILENKGHVRHAADGNRYVYEPRLPRERAGRPALAGVLETFFDGSAEKAVAALLDLSRHDLTNADLDRLSALIEQARLEGR
ncbi:MAG: BlaI/MecI/CopY family transcriptional regulator [Syntrophomonadaceae bacterium]